MDLFSYILLFCGFAFLAVGITMKFKKSPAKPITKASETKPLSYFFPYSFPFIINFLFSKSVLKKEEVTAPEIPEITYGPIYIYFGSQTGTAANYAQTLGDEASRNGFTPKIIDLIDFDVKQLKNCKLATFLMATHGEGDPTDNAKGFNEWIADSERSNEELKGVKFLVFGLGNKQYQFYNAQGRKINEYMEKLGAERYVRIFPSNTYKKIESINMEKEMIMIVLKMILMNGNLVFGKV